MESKATDRAVRLAKRFETPDQDRGASPLRDPRTIGYPSRNFLNLFSGTNPIFGAGMSPGDLLKSCPRFGNLVPGEPRGHSWFHSFPGRKEKRFPNGRGAFGRTTRTQARNRTFQSALKFEF